MIVRHLGTALPRCSGLLEARRPLVEAESADVIWHVAWAAVTASVGYGFFMLGVDKLSEGARQNDSEIGGYGWLFLVAGAVIAGYVLFKAFGG